MDKREELKRKLERIEREESVRQEGVLEQSEASAPSTASASASPPPAPSLTTEQIQEITRGEVEKALLKERVARREESASERARTDARFDELSRGLTDTNERLTDTDERVTNLREDTHDSLIPMAQEIAELRSRQNNRTLPPAREPRNVTPRPTWSPTTLPVTSMYRPPSLSTGPEMPDRALERTSHQPPRTRIESGPPAAGPTYETEPTNPLVMLIWAAILVMLLILAVWMLWTLLALALIHPWMAAALIAAAFILLVWIGAILLFWSAEAKMLSVITFLVGAMVLFSAWTGYTIYQSLTEPKPNINGLGR